MPIECSQPTVKSINREAELRKQLAEAHRQAAQQKQAQPRIGGDGKPLPWQPLPPRRG